MSPWLLMMTLCLSPNSCNDVAIDEFESEQECVAAVDRSNRKQHVDHADIAFFCQQEGEKRI